MIGKIYYSYSKNELILISDKVFLRFYLADFGDKDSKMAIITPMSRYSDLVYIGKL